jgi:hypothetical protein
MEFFNEECPPMRSAICYFRVDRREISFFRFILEAYDGLAALRTLDPRQGVVAVHIAPGRDAEFRDLLADLKHTFRIEAVKSDMVDDDPSFL